jgi:hypothetical protein
MAPREWHYIHFCGRSYLMLTNLLCHRLAENAAFLIGCAYFVAGSYPESNSIEDDFEKIEDRVDVEFGDL